MERVIYRTTNQIVPANGQQYIRVRVKSNLKIRYFNLLKKMIYSTSKAVPKLGLIL